ncbi:hypothetical protein KCG51_08040 [Neisseria subflava]|uniref:hypothetical protein n=1 Tax=Neisseria subflava TaxID=28449 RepID=UPI00202A332F|nr:hypothetical protein [Neisseria subflava]MCL9778958.1 hypothetical protein [Neisseria subflava]UTG76795.1 hypothetical protein KCG51_08040 [Neisseria subflava]
MAKETKNSALTTAQAFYHQSIVALDKCFEMGEGNCIYLEKDGDISLITEGENTGSQIEVKDVTAALTDHHESFWKTLKNWLAPEFNHEQYNHLILYTTQLFGKTTKLAKWNDSNSQERLKILQDIYSPNSSTSEIAKMQADIMNKGDDALLQIIGKVTLFTEAESKEDILNRIKERNLSGIPDNNQNAFLQGLIGFIYTLGNKESWCIPYGKFKEKCVDLTSKLCRKEFTFPDFQGLIATEQEVAKNAAKKFVSKIQDINYTEVIPEAVGNWLEFTKSLNEDLDNSPAYREKTKNYQEELISIYEAKYRKAKRNSTNPCDLYDDFIGSEPLLIGSDRPHIAYRNGVMHDAMDSNANLKWDTTK